MCAIVKILLLAEATGKLYNKIINETNIDKVSFYETQGKWIVICKAQDCESIEFSVTDDQMLNDDHHDYLRDEINKCDWSIKHQASIGKTDWNYSDCRAIV